MTKPLCAFNFDGVLVASGDSLRRAFYEKLSSLGYRFLRSPDDVTELLDENIADALISHGVTPDHLCAVWEDIALSTVHADVALVPGIAEMLAAVAPVCTLAIVSSNSGDAIRQVLGRLGILPRFSVISGGEGDVAKMQRLEACIRTAGATKECTLYVGSARGDLAEAREVGITTVGAAWGLQPEERLAAASPECIVHDPAELADLIRAFASSGRATA
jgi:phosphoglycolate phosphatase